MSKEKTYNKNDLVEFYYKCPLFNKYCQYNLWFGNFNEYSNIKYCKKYIYWYIRLSIENFILQHFSLSILFVLYASPRFIKFVESGFLKYLDFHFLLLFYNNCLNCSSKDKKKIENFVHEYFKRYVKIRLKQDLLTCINKSINELPSNSFRLHLTDRIKYVRINVKRFSLEHKNFIIIDKQEKEFFLSNYLLKYLFYDIAFFNNKQVCVKSFNYKPFINNMISFLIFILSKLELDKSYLFFIENKFSKLNKDIQNLAERLETLSVFYIRYKNVGLYIKVNILFDNNFYCKSFKFNKSFKSFNSLLKSFNSGFNTNKHKI